MSQQQIPPPTAEDRAIDLKWRYLKREEWLELSGYGNSDIVLSLIRRCHAAEAELTAESQQREAAEKLVMELEAELETWKLRAGEKWSQHDLDSAKARGELQYRVFDLERQLATVRAETVEECAKATCRGCKLNAPIFIENGDQEWHELRRSNGFSSDYPCSAAAIRRLNATTTEPQS